MDADSRVRRGRHNTRLSRDATEALATWFEAHRANPYPTNNDKAILQAFTGLDLKQINDWFANARRRRTRPMPPINQHGELRGPYTRRDEVNTLQLARLASMKPYQCTFCEDSFATKYDWNRHEISVHLPLKRYICCPFGPFTIDAITKDSFCSYCGQKDTTNEHVRLHHHNSCQNRPPEARVFNRKDHLKQHLQSVHECDLLPHMEEQWMLQATYVNSRCGFCGIRFSLWSERNEHIATHYMRGCRMEEWRGCRGFDSEVAALVTHAMPPFLIGQQDAMPFRISSAKCGPVQRRPGYQEGDTIWDDLVRDLQDFIRQSSSRCLILSDVNLRDHARKTIYGSINSRCSTPADNAEWLDLFKRSYSLSLLPSLADQTHNIIAEDLEVYQDLGIRLPVNLRSAQRSSALVTLFSSNAPVEKTYQRFSSLEIPFHLACAFETIAKPWPDSGVIGDSVNLKEILFLHTLNLAVGSHPTQPEDQPSSVSSVGDGDTSFSSSDTAVQNRPLEWACITLRTI